MTDPIDSTKEPTKTRKPRIQESTEARTRRRDAETQARRTEAAADDARIDRMIRENIRLHGA